MAEGKQAGQVYGETSQQEQEQEQEEYYDENQLVRWVVRFNPTDQQLISSYVANMNFHNPLPLYPEIPAIDAAYFYSVPPRDLVADRFAASARQWFFFVGGVETTRTRGVGNGGAAGSWRSFGEENPIHDSDGQVMGVRIVFTYYSGTQASRRTYWRMDEYRLPHYNNNNNNAQWVLERIRRGREYYGRRRLGRIAEE